MIRCHAFGWPFTVEASDPGVAAEVEGLLSGLRATGGPAAGDAGRYELVGPRTDVQVRSHGVGIARAEVEEAVRAVLLDVHAHADGLAPIAIVHAAGVVAPSGGAALLAGPSHAGKSTLAVHAALDGWTYLAEDRLGVDERGWALPHATPIAVRAGGPAGTPSASLVAPTALPGGYGSDPVPIAVVALLDPAPSAAVWQPISRAAALRALVEGSIRWAPDAAAARFAALAAAVGAARCGRLHRAAPATMLEHLATESGRSSDPPCG